MGRRSRVAWGIAAIVATALLSGLLVCWVFRWQILRWLLFGERGFNRELAQQVVAEVTRGTLKPDADGKVALPPRYASMTTDGHIYVNHGRHRLTLMLFTTMQARHWIMEGYLFSNRPLTSADTDGRDPRGGQATLNLRYFTWLERYHGVTPEPHEVQLRQKLNQHWYRVVGDDD